MMFFIHISAVFSFVNERRSVVLVYWETTLVTEIFFSNHDISNLHMTEPKQDIFNDVTASEMGFEMFVFIEDPLEAFFFRSKSCNSKLPRHCSNIQKKIRLVLSNNSPNWSDVQCRGFFWSHWVLNLSRSCEILKVLKK